MTMYADLVKKPIDPSTGWEYDKCEYALFTGCNLGAYNPELVVKLYDSLRFQHPDLGIIIMCCGVVEQRAGDNEKSSEMLSEVLSAWKSLGKPRLICACPSCLKEINEHLPEVPTISLYNHLIALKISGGCHEESFCIWEKSESEDYEAIKILAEDMGAKITSNPADPGCSYITSNISIRNMLRKQGEDAIHILELIYGPGDSKNFSPEELLANRMELKQAMLDLCF